MRRSLVFCVLMALLAACVEAPSGGASSPSADGTTGPSSGPITRPPAPVTSAGPGVRTSVVEVPEPTGEHWIDSTDAFALLEPLKGMHGHAAAWADIDDDGFVDLVVGTFADRDPDVYRLRGADDPSPDRLMKGSRNGFRPVDELGFGRTSGAVFADLDGDFDVDLVLSRNVKQIGTGGDVTMLFENVDGAFVRRPSSGLDGTLGGRSIGVFDDDGDGLLDLFVVEDRYAGGSSRLFHNRGGLEFVDVTSDRGLPSDLEGLGVAAVDLDRDGWSDLFVSGSNRLFRGGPDGFSEVDSGVFVWTTFGDEDLVAGVASGDLDRDGRLDLVVGHHFNSTVDFGTRVPVRVYLNRSEPGALEFVDATDDVGMVGLPTKAPHVEIVDLDNDGWPDILTSASAGDGTEPAVFMHAGMSEGMPRFVSPTGLGSKRYWVTAPSADVDRDFRVDVLAVEWEPALPSILFKNERTVGNAIRVEGDGVELIGAEVSVFDRSVGELIAYHQIVASVGYTAGVESVAHVGIGQRDAVDVVVRTHDGVVYGLDAVEANSIVTIGR